MCGCEHTASPFYNTPRQSSLSDKEPTSTGILRGSSRTQGHHKGNTLYSFIRVAFPPSAMSVVYLTNMYLLVVANGYTVWASSTGSFDV